MRKNLLLTTALVALVATNANAASGSSDISSVKNWSNNTISAQPNENVDGGLVYYNGKSTPDQIISGNISNNTIKATRKDISTEVFNQGGIVKLISGSNLGGLENVVVENNKTSLTTNQAAGKATVNGGIVGIWTSGMDHISGDFKNNTSEVLFNGDGEYNGTSASVGGAILHVEGQYGEPSSFVGVKEINGNFINNHAKGLAYASGGAIYYKAGADKNASGASDLVTTNIKGKFASNSAEAITKNNAASDTLGGAIAIKRHNENKVNVNVSAIFEKNSVSTNATKALGGALYNGKGNGEVNVSNSSFLNNEAKSVSGSALGGAIYNDSTLNLDKDTFTGNKSSDGGAINNAANGKLDVADSTFSANEAMGGNKQGGAISNTGAANVSGSTFTGNKAERYGGAIANLENSSPDGFASLDIKSSTFDGNSTYNGGAIWNDPKGKVNIDNGTFKNNTASNQGGAIYNFSNGTVNVSNNSSFSGNKATNNGGAIYNKGALDVKGADFSANETTAANGYGGAIYNRENATIALADSQFNGNKAKNGGAIVNNMDGSITSIKNTSFTANEATSGQGGAVMNQGNIGTISGVEFNGNIGSNGAALWNGTAGSIDSIDNVKFVNNKATSGLGQGGAITNAGSIKTVSNTVFEGNSAKIGGAFANVTPQGNPAQKLTFENVTFKNNTAEQGGGAIFNKETLELKGDTVFEGNKANGKLNDLNNAGTLEVSGNLTLDGGIAGSEGTINFAEGTNLTVKQGTTTIDGKDINGVSNTTLNLVIANGSVAPEYQLIKNSNAADGSFKLAQNNLYNIVESETQKGTYEIAKKSANEVAQSTGASASQAQAIDAVTQGTSSNGTFNNIANSINDNLQSSNKADVQAALTALDTMGADEAPIVQQTQVENTAQIISAVSSRLSSGAIASAKQGAASGDSWLEKGAMWVQSLFNKSKLDDHGSVKGFDADTNGIAFGFEKKINNDVKVGVAYAYNNTDVDGFMRDTEIDAHSAILYSEYKPAEWFVNTVISYTWGEYDEDKYVLGNTLSADYDVNSIAWQAMTGYEFALNNTVITPQAGLRYIHYEQDSYKDSADTYVSGDNADLLTAVVGAKISTDYQLDNGMMLVPEARLAMTYDLNTDSANASVRLANGGAYSVKGDRLDRVAVEFGAGVKAEVNDNVELSVAYEGSYRDNYEDHTGLLNLKYNF